MRIACQVGIAQYGVNNTSLRFAVGNNEGMWLVLHLFTAVKHDHIFTAVNVRAITRFLKGSEETASDLTYKLRLSDKINAADKSGFHSKSQLISHTFATTLLNDAFLFVMIRKLSS